MTITPWHIYAGGVAYTLITVGTRPGGLMYWGYVGASMLAASYIKPEFAAYAGVGSGLYLLTNTNFIHPFGRGPNPLRGPTI